MGEMEEADIDYISTEKTSHKVGAKKWEQRGKTGVSLLLQTPGANAGISKTPLQSSNEIKLTQ